MNMDDSLLISLDKQFKGKNIYKEYSREELIVSEVKDRLDIFEEDQTVFIDTLNDVEQYDLLSELLRIIQNPVDNDYLQCFFKLQEMLDIKKRDTAEFLAEQHARDTGL